MEEPSYKDMEVSAKMVLLHLTGRLLAVVCMYVRGRGYVQVSWEARVIGSPGTRITGPELPIELPARAVLALNLNC